MDIIIRPLRTDDYTVWRAFYDEYNHTVNDDAYTRSVFENLLDPATNCLCFIAAKENTPVGFAHLVFHHGVKHNKQVLYLEDLFVATAYRGQRIAQKLIDKGLELAKESGCGRFYWLTDSGNTTAQKIYERYVNGTQKLRYAIELPQT